MTKAVGDDESMLNSLQEVVHLFELAQTSVFKLMSSVSTCLFLISGLQQLISPFLTGLGAEVPS